MGTENTSKEDVKEPKIYYECDNKACESCHCMNCFVTSNIEHARNFIKLNGVYVEKSSIEDSDNGFVHHTHCCEIDLLHKKDKNYWKKYCPRKKKPSKKFWAGMEDECDNCNHSITIEFFKDKMYICSLKYVDHHTNNTLK